MTGLKEGSPLWNYLGRKSYTSLGSVLGKANDYIKGEEFDRAVSNREPEKQKERVILAEIKEDKSQMWSKEEATVKERTKDMTVTGETASKAVGKWVNAKRNSTRTLNSPLLEARSI